MTQKSRAEIFWGDGWKSFNIFSSGRGCLVFSGTPCMSHFKLLVSKKDNLSKKNLNLYILWKQHKNMSHMKGLGISFQKMYSFHMFTYAETSENLTRRPRKRSKSVFFHDKISKAEYFERKNLILNLWKQVQMLFLFIILTFLRDIPFISSRFMKYSKFHSYMPFLSQMTT